MRGVGDEGKFSEAAAFSAEEKNSDLPESLMLPSTAVVSIPVKKAVRLRLARVQIKMYTVKTSSQLSTPTNS